jgi:hypothetical protein
MVIFSFFFSTSSVAQGNNQKLLTIQTDSILVAENGSLISLTLILDNPDSSPFNGKILISAITGISLLGNEVAEVNIAAASKIYRPIRLFINNEVPAGESLIRINLLDSLSQIQAQFRSKLRVESKREVRLINFRSTELMQHVGDSLSVSVLLNNQGNSSEVITLTASFPDLMGGKSLIHKKVEIAPFKDTVVVFRRLIIKELFKI